MLYPAWYIIGKIRTSDDFYLHIMNIHSYILFQAYLLDFQYNLYLIHNNEMKRDLPTYQFMKSVLSVCLSPSSFFAGDGAVQIQALEYIPCLVICSAVIEKVKESTT